jgi:serine/threonine protein phosphatase PrpC
VTVLRSGSATDVGRVRKINQDLPLESSNLFAVADGMGGHVGGEVAAQVAVDALRQGFMKEPTRNGLHNAFSKANRAVWQESQDHNELRGMGTTLTTAGTHSPWPTSGTLGPTSTPTSSWCRSRPTTVWPKNGCATAR